MSELGPVADRRQRALEEFHDVTADDGTALDWGDKAEAAIEVATQVKINRDMLAEFAKAWHEAPQDGPPGTRRRAGLEAVFRAAGFEVVE